MTPRQQYPLRQRFEEWWEGRPPILRDVPKQKVRDIVEAIAQLTIQTHHGETKQKKRVWSDVKKLEASFRGLQLQHPHATRQLEDAARQLGVGDLLNFLKLFREAIPLDRLEGTGNSTEARLNRAQTELTALLVIYLLTTRGLMPLTAITLEADGLYMKLTGDFFTMATEDVPNNLKQVCREVLNSHRKRIERLVVGSVRSGKRVVGIQWPRTPRRPRQR